MLAFLCDFAALRETVPGSYEYVIIKTAPELPHAGVPDGPSMKRILIIDDEPNLTEIINAFAGRLGYVSDTAHSGETAMELLTKHDYWAVLCDLKMPGLNGLEIFDKIKAMNSETAKRFVLLTGALIDDKTEDAVTKNHIIIFRKPFNFQGIKDTFALLEQHIVPKKSKC